MPQPTSRTFLPALPSKSANPGICDSTKYLRASTSSKYARLPTACRLCRMLHGLKSQNFCTSSIFFIRPLYKICNLGQSRFSRDNLDVQTTHVSPDLQQIFSVHTRIRLHLSNIVRVGI